MSDTQSPPPTGSDGTQRLSFIRKLLISLTVVLTLYGAQIGSWTDPFNRYFRAWVFADAVAIVLSVSLIGLLGAVVAQLVEIFCLKRLQRIGRAVFLLALTTGLASCFTWCVLHGCLTAKYNFVFLAVWLGIVATLVCWRKTLLRLGTRLCLVMSPLVAILFIQMLSWNSWKSDVGSLSDVPAVEVVSDRPAGARASPVYLFVFDEWSYVRSTHSGEFLPEQENIRRLCREATVFHNARSPSNTTKTSLPRIIYQADGVLRRHDARTDWDVQGDVRPSPDAPSLFQLARDRGYRTALVGFYHPYGTILDGQLDFCRTYSHDPQSKTLSGRMGELALKNVRFWTDPLSRLAWQKTYPGVFSKHWVALNRQFQNDAGRLVKTWPNNTFAMFHWPLPHAPFVFNPDGSYRGPFAEERMKGTPEDYQRHLLYLDRVIGELVDTLKASGKYEESTIILTSDHSWRRDPAVEAQTADDCWIPLIVKLPHQTVPYESSKPFCITELAPLIESVFRNRPEHREAYHLVQQLCDPPAPPIRTAVTPPERRL
jgi:hypothetical protein